MESTDSREAQDPHAVADRDIDDGLILYKVSGPVSCPTHIFNALMNHMSSVVSGRRSGEVPSARTARVSNVPLSRSHVDHYRYTVLACSPRWSEHVQSQAVFRDTVVSNNVSKAKVAGRLDTRGAIGRAIDRARVVDFGFGSSETKVSKC